MNIESVEKTIQIFKISIFLKIALLYIILLPIFLFFGDRVGWEGDDIGQLEGIINFQYKGEMGVYRYYWQPLSYQINIFLNSLTNNNPKFLFAMPQFFGAASISVLTGAVYQFSRKKITFVFIFLILLLLPELFFSGLYFNSTVFAMLPMTITLLLLFWDDKAEASRSSWNDFRHLIIGITSTIACFFRLDFLLSLPLIIYLIFFGKSFRIRSILLYFLGSFSVVCLAIIAKIFEPTMTLGILQLHSDAAESYPFIRSLMNLFTITNLGVWIALFIYLTYFLISRFKNKNWQELTILLLGIITLYPISELTTPKYLIPGIIFLPFAFVKIFMDLQEWLGYKKIKRLSCYLIGVIISLQIISFQPAKAFPYIQIKPIPGRVYTADGSRPLGAYLRGYNSIRKNNSRNNSEIPTGLYSITHRIAKIIENSNRNFTVISLDKKGNIFASERVLQSISLYLQIEGYQIDDYTLKFNELPVNNQSRTITLMKNNKIVKLLRLNEQEFSNYKEDDDENNILIKFPSISNDDPHASNQKRDFYKSLDAI